MELKFLGQGYESVSIDSVGNHLITYFSALDYHTFTAFSAFTTSSAIKGLNKLIENAPDNFNCFNFILGINQRGTSKEALEEVLKLKANAYIFYHNPNLIFHPKIYLFEGSIVSKVIIGSSNLTSSGLFANIESSVLVTLKQNNTKDVEFLDQLKSYYKGIFNTDDPNLKPITKQLIDSLVDSGIVPTAEEQKFEFSKKTNKGERKTKSKIFPSRKMPAIPDAFKSKSPVVHKSKNTLNNYIKKKYLYTESSYHFPQGVHIGHILYALKIIKDETFLGSHLDAKYIRLRGGLNSGNLGSFQRKTKYLLVALMEMEIIKDNRNLSNPLKLN